MAVTIKIRDFIPNAMNGPIDMNSDTFAIALSNTAPSAQGTNPTLDGNGILANVTQISYTNYADDLTVDRRLQSVTSTATGGTYTFDAADFTITATGGALATFRYIYIFDDTPTSPADPLVLCIDNESAITLASGESVTVSFNASGILTIV
jgi:hypothetical protein